MLARTSSNRSKTKAWVKKSLTGKYSDQTRLEKYALVQYKTDGRGVINYDKKHGQGYKRVTELFTSDTTDKVLRYCRAYERSNEAEEKDLQDALHAETAKRSSESSLKKLIKDVPLCAIDWYALCSERYSPPQHSAQNEVPLLSQERSNYNKKQLTHALPNLFRWVNERLVIADNTHEAIEDNAFIQGFRLLLDIDIEEEAQQLRPDDLDLEPADQLMRTVLGEDRDEVVEELAELFEDEVNSIEELIDSEETSNQKSPEEEEEPGVQQSLWGFQKLSELRDKWGSDQNKHIVMFLVAVSLLNVSHRSIETILQYLPVDIKKRRQLRYEFHKILKQIEDREQDVPESHEERKQRAEWASRIHKIYFCRKGCKAFYQEDNSLCEFCGLNVETSGDYFRYFSPMEYIRYLYSNSAGADGLKLQTSMNGKKVYTAIPGTEVGIRI
jgi:hypothetical protein